MKKAAIVFGLLFFAMIMGGCAFTDSTLKLRCTIPDPLERATSLPEISIKKFVDARKVDDPRFLYFKNNNYGQTSGRLSSEDVSVADFVTDVVRKTAEKAGVRVVDGSEFVLTGRLLSLESSARIGFFSAAIESKMHGELQLTRKSQLIRKDSIVEKGEADRLQVATDADYEDSLEKMFNNLSVSVLEFIKSGMGEEAALANKSTR